MACSTRSTPSTPYWIASGSNRLTWPASYRSTGTWRFVAAIRSDPSRSLASMMYGAPNAFPSRSVSG